MECQAKITDEFGGKYSCENEATVKVTVKNISSYLEHHITRSKCLCTMHRARYVHRHRTKGKGLGRRVIITETPLEQNNCPLNANSNEW